MGHFATALPSSSPSRTSGSNSTPNGLDSIPNGSDSGSQQSALLFQPSSYSQALPSSQTNLAYDGQLNGYVQYKNMYSIADDFHTEVFYLKSISFSLANFGNHLLLLFFSIEELKEPNTNVSGRLLKGVKRLDPYRMRKIESICGSYVEGGSWRRRQLSGFFAET